MRIVPLDESRRGHVDRVQSHRCTGAYHGLIPGAAFHVEAFIAARMGTTEVRLDLSPQLLRLSILHRSPGSGAHPLVFGPVQHPGQYVTSSTVAHGERHTQQLRGPLPVTGKLQRVHVPRTTLEGVFQEALHTRIRSHGKLIDRGVHALENAVIHAGRSPRLPGEHQILQGICLSRHGTIPAQELRPALVEHEADLAVRDRVRSAQGNHHQLGARDPIRPDRGGVQLRDPGDGISAVIDVANHDFAAGGEIRLFPVDDGGRHGGRQAAGQHVPGGSNAVGGRGHLDVFDDVCDVHGSRRGGAG